jgi:hypothetical protein
MEVYKCPFACLRDSKKLVIKTDFGVASGESRRQGIYGQHSINYRIVGVIDNGAFGTVKDIIWQVGDGEPRPVLLLLYNIGEV